MIVGESATVMVRDRLLAYLYSCNDVVSQVVWVTLMLLVKGRGCILVKLTITEAL